MNCMRYFKSTVTAPTYSEGRRMGKNQENKHIFLVMKVLLNEHFMRIAFLRINFFCEQFLFIWNTSNDKPFQFNRKRIFLVDRRLFCFLLRTDAQMKAINYTKISFKKTKRNNFTEFRISLDGYVRSGETNNSINRFKMSFFIQIVDC